MLRIVALLACILAVARGLSTPMADPSGARSIAPVTDFKGGAGEIMTSQHTHDAGPGSAPIRRSLDRFHSRETSNANVFLDGQSPF